MTPPIQLVLLAMLRSHYFSKVRVTESGCWVWPGKGDGRYGYAYLCGVRYKAHRLFHILFTGRIKRGYVVDHECNNTRCCNPKHLAAVTQSVNMKLCFARGRGKSPFIKRQE